MLWLLKANIKCKSLCMHSDVLWSQMSHESSTSPPPSRPRPLRLPVAGELLRQRHLQLLPVKRQNMVRVYA